MFVPIVIATPIPAFTLSAIALSDERPYPALSPEIAMVESGGLWEVGKRSGRYRAVVRRGCSPEHCYDDLFLEWIEVREQDEAKLAREKPVSATVATKRVAEIPGVTQVSDIKFVFSKKATKLEVQHEGSDGEDRWTICLVLGAPGRYASKTGPCGRAG